MMNFVQEPKITIVGDEPAYDGRYLKVRKKKFLDKSGKEGIWEYVQRPDAVFVLPITADGSMILLRHYRVPLEGFVIETVAGMMDGGHSESMEEVARRELREEAGCEADALDAVLSWPYRSGSASGRCHGFIATGVRRTGENAGDALEDIQVFEVPFGKFWDFYRSLPPDTLIGSEVLALYAVAASRDE